MEKTRLSNGISFFSQTDPHLHSFCVSIYIKAGVMYEDSASHGYTHAFEHMVFRNLTSFYGKDFYSFLAYYGIDFNASTYKELIAFDISGCTTGIGFVTELISHMFSVLSLPKSEFDTEIGRIKAEIREQDDKSSIDSLLSYAVWHDTPLCRHIAGTCTSLGSLSRAKLNKFREHLLSGSDMLIFVTGNVSDDELLPIKLSASSIPTSTSLSPRHNDAVMPSDFMRRKNNLILKSSDTCSVGISFDIDNSHCSLGARNLIYDTLFSGDDSLMYQHLSENTSYIYSYDATLEQYNNISVIKVTFVVSERYLYSSLRECMTVFNLMKSGGFDFDTSLKKEINYYTVAQDSPTDYNFDLAYNSFFFDNSGLDPSLPGLGMYEGITKDTIVSCSRSVFRLSNLVCVIKQKKRSQQYDTAASILKELEK